ncbi:hypothetical protein BD626DRAFT_516638, partial [Schizophyllum amplum]
RAVFITIISHALCVSLMLQRSSVSLSDARTLLSNLALTSDDGYYPQCLSSQMQGLIQPSKRSPWRADQYRYFARETYFPQSS